MDNVSRPLIALLVGTVAFFALWITMLKPSPSGPAGSRGGVGQYQSAINGAKQAVAASNRGAHGGTVVTTPRSTPAGTGTTKSTATSNAPAETRATTAPVVKPASSAPTAVVSRTTRAAEHRHAVVVRALRSHRVMALLFFNPAAADDEAVKAELAAVPVRGGQVVKLAVPLSELSRYAAITNQVSVNESPTLVVIDGRAQAMTITGFADRFEIAQRIDDALAAG